DFNRDGKDDLVVANTSLNSVNGSVSVLLGHGDGTFGTATYYPVGSGPLFVAAADFDNDQNPDVVVANNFGVPDGQGNYRFFVSVLMGIGNGSLAGAVAYQVGRFPLSIAIGDLNSDGKLDL